MDDLGTSVERAGNAGVVDVGLLATMALVSDGHYRDNQVLTGVFERAHSENRTSTKPYQNFASAITTYYGSRHDESEALALFSKARDEAYLALIHKGPQTTQQEGYDLLTIYLASIGFINKIDGIQKVRNLGPLSPS